MAGFQGPPAFDFYSTLSGLGDTLQANQKRAMQREAFAPDAATGSVDYNKALTTFARAGDLDSAAKVAAIQKAIAPENTPDIQNYNFAVKNGYKGSLLDFAKEKAAASRPVTNVNNTTNVTNAGEKAYDQALNKDLADTFLTYQKEGRSAGDQLNTISTMERAAKDPNFYSGTGANAITAYRRGAAALGLGDTSAAAPNELFGKMSNKLVIDSLGSLSQGVSNGDRTFVESTVPNLQNTPDGNAKIFEVMRKVAQRKQEVARLATDYAAKNGGRIDYKFNSVLQDYAEKNPLFPQSGSQSNTPAAQPQQAAPRQAPDGKFYVPDPNRPGKYLQVIQ